MLTKIIDTYSVLDPLQYWSAYWDYIHIYYHFDQSIEYNFNNNLQYGKKIKIYIKIVGGEYKHHKIS